MRLRYCLLIIGIITSIAGVASASLLDGLESHFPFDGNATDTTGNGHDGSPVGGISWSNQAIFDGCLSISSGYIQIGPRNNDGVMTYDENQDFTWAFWFKPSGSNNDDEKLLSRRRYNGDNDQVSMHISYFSDGRVRMLFGANRDPATLGWSTSKCNDGEWHQVSIVRNATSGKMSMYVDGNLEDNQEYYASNYTAASSFRIGQEGETFGGNGQYHGLIDDVRIYSRALSPEEISQLYGQAKPVNNPPSLADIGNKSVDEGDLLQFTISADDRDNDALVYSAINLPKGATFNPNTKTFSWKPMSDQSGNYDVTFKVTDGKAENSETIRITVYDVPIPNRSPIADFLVDKSQGILPLTVTFDASNSSDPDGSIVKYEWDWESDGRYDAEGVKKSHTYNSAGMFDVTLKVTDNSESSDTKSLQINVLKPADLAIIKVTVAPEQPIAGEYATIKVTIRNHGDVEWQKAPIKMQIEVWDIAGEGPADSLNTWFHEDSYVKRQVGGYEVKLSSNLAPKGEYDAEIPFIFTAPDFSDQLHITLLSDDDVSNNAGFVIPFEVKLNNIVYVNCLGNALTFLTASIVNSENVKYLVDYNKYLIKFIQMGEITNKAIESIKRNDYMEFSKTAINGLMIVAPIAFDITAKESVGRILSIVKGAWTEITAKGCSAAFAHGMIDGKNLLEGLFKEMADNFNITSFSVASPADIIVEDTHGNIISIDQNGNITNQMEIASAFLLGDTKVVQLLAEDQSLSVTLRGTGSGSADFSIVQPQSGGAVIHGYTEIPTSPNSTARMDIGISQNDFSLKIDKDGDGKIDEYKQPEESGETVLEPIVRVFTEDQQISKNEEFTVNIAVENIKDMAGYQFDFAFNPEVLEVLEIREGTFLKKDGISTFWQDPAMDNANGKIIGIQGARLGQGGSSGTGDLATISFIARENGDSELSIKNAIFSDINANSIPCAIVDSSVSVNVSQPWDVNEDGKIDIFDIVIVGQQFGSKSPSEPRADVNQDGIINILDIVLIGQHFGESISAGPMKGTWSVDPKYLPLLQELYEIIANMKHTNEDILATKALLHRLILTASANITQTQLLQNYPNPFNPETWIPYKLAQPSNVFIRIYDISGRLIRRLNLGYKEAGYYVSPEMAAYWNGADNTGQLAASGIYVCQIIAGEYSAVRKMVLMR